MILYLKLQELWPKPVHHSKKYLIQRLKLTIILERSGLLVSLHITEAGKPTFEISDEIEIGMGIHGEPGIKREKLKPANQLVMIYIKE